MSALQQQLTDGLATLGIDLASSQIDRLIRFVELLHKWNRVYNLTAVREKPDMVSRHLLDSLSLFPWVAGDVVDLGTGAGLPVIPLAIAKPSSRFVSVESIGKKTRFQQQVVAELDVTNVDVQQVRAETLRGMTLFDGSNLADIVMSRAFTAPNDFLMFADPLLRPGGTALVMLGQSDKLVEKVSDTFDDLPAPFVLEALHRIDLPGVDAERHVAVCRKEA